MFDIKLNDEVRFFLGEYELSGIESLSFSNSSNVSNIFPLGTKKGITSVGSRQSQSVEFSRNLIYKDPILDYTGVSPVSGDIYYENSHYGFNTAYLSNYSVNCAVGASPRVSVVLDVLDEMLTGVDTSNGLNPVTHPPIDIPSQGSMVANVDGKTETNRVTSFNYSLKPRRKYYYTIGSRLPSDVERFSPMEYSADITIDVDDAFLQNSFDFLNEREDKSVNISINGRNGLPIQNLIVPNASLVSENLSVSAEGGATLTLNYRGHI
jgi:hypothetical protein